MKQKILFLLLLSKGLSQWKLAIWTFTVNFTYNTGDDLTITDAVVWNLTKGADAADMSKNTSSITIKSTDPLFAILNKEFTNKKKT